MKSFFFKWLLLIYVVLLHFVTNMNIEAVYSDHAEIIKLASDSFYFLAYAVGYSQINRVLDTRW